MSSCQASSPCKEKSPHRKDEMTRTFVKRKTFRIILVGSRFVATRSERARASGRRNLYSVPADGGWSANTRDETRVRPVSSDFLQQIDYDQTRARRIPTTSLFTIIPLAARRALGNPHPKELDREQRAVPNRQLVSWKDPQTVMRRTERTIARFLEWEKKRVCW